MCVILYKHKDPMPVHVRVIFCKRQDTRVKQHTFSAILCTGNPVPVCQIDGHYLVGIQMDGWDQLVSAAMVTHYFFFRLACGTHMGWKRYIAEYGAKGGASCCPERLEVNNNSFFICGNLFLLSWK